MRKIVMSMASLCVVMAGVLGGTPAEAIESRSSKACDDLDSWVGTIMEGDLLQYAGRYDNEKYVRNIAFDARYALKSAKDPENRANLKAILKYAKRTDSFSLYYDRVIELKDKIMDRVDSGTC